MQINAIAICPPARATNVCATLTGWGACRLTCVEIACRRQAAGRLDRHIYVAALARAVGKLVPTASRNSSALNDMRALRIWIMPHLPE
jgi:hypothetical protein